MVDLLLKTFIFNFPQTKGGTTEVGFLLLFYRITFGFQDLLSWTCLDLRVFQDSLSPCLDLPRLACIPGIAVVAYLPGLA